MFRKISIMLLTILLLLTANVGLAAKNKEEKKMPRFHYAMVEVKTEGTPVLSRFFKKKMLPAIQKEEGTLAIYNGIAKPNNHNLDVDTRTFYFFEFYNDEAAYQTHLANPVFKEYIESTAPYLVDKRLNATLPVLLQMRKGKRVTHMDYEVFSVPDEETKQKLLEILTAEAKRAYKKNKDIYICNLSVEEKDPLSIYVWHGYKDEETALKYVESQAQLIEELKELAEISHVGVADADFEVKAL